MADPVILAIAFAPDHQPKPAYYNEQQFLIRITATRLSDGAFLDVTGLTLRLLRPDNSTLLFTQAQMTRLSTGLYEASVIPGSTFGNWRALAACTGPFQTRTREAFSVQADGVDPPPAPTPFLVTDDLATPITQAGGLLTVQRMGSLPEAQTATGMKLVGVQDGVSKQIATTFVGGGGGSFDGPYLVIDGGHGVKPGNGQPTGNQSQVVRDAAAELLSLYGHGRLIFRNCLKLDEQIVLPPNIQAGFAIPPLADKDWNTGSGLEESPALYFGPSGQLQSQHSLINICALPAGFSVPSGPDVYPYSTQGMMEALDFQSDMLGRQAPFYVANASGYPADDLLFSDLSAFGFNTLIDSFGATRTRYRNIYGDCANGIKVFSSGGNTSLQRLVMRGFLSRAGGVRNISCPILGTANVGGKLALIVGPAREPPTTAEWAPNAWIGAGKKVYWADKSYNTNNAGFFGPTPPTHGPSPRKADNGEVELVYKGPWNSGALAPATTIPVTTGGFLKPGHSVLLNIPPRDCYTGNPTYPHWSTPGAPPDIALMGGDIVDPLMRGRMVVYDFGAVDANSWTVILDCPYDIGIAAACVNALLAIIPTSRFGSTLWTQDADGIHASDILSKGPRIDIRSGGGSLKVRQGSSEDPNASEEDVSDLGNIALSLGPGSGRAEVEWNAKSKGVLVRFEVDKNNYLKFSGLLRGATYRTIHHVAGAAEVRANFEGPPIIHSEPTARHLIVHHIGQMPTITSPDGRGKERVTLVGLGLPEKRKPGYAIMGANGVSLGLGLEEEAWQPSTTYNENSLVVNAVHAEEDALYLYRMVAAPDGVSGADDGPQHTTGALVDGTCTWFCLGPYAGGQSLFELRRSAGGIDMYGADPSTGENRTLALTVRKDRVDSLVPFYAPNLDPPVFLSGTTTGSENKGLTPAGTNVPGASSGIGALQDSSAHVIQLSAVAQRIDAGADGGEKGACAMWVKNVLLRRGPNGSSTAVFLEEDESPLGVLPTTIPTGQSLSTARLDLTTVNTQNTGTGPYLAVTANVSALPYDVVVEWKVRMTVMSVTGSAAAVPGTDFLFMDGSTFDFMDGTPFLFLS